MEKVKSYIESFIKESVLSSELKTKYREPIIGFADARDREFERIKAITHDQHILPEVLLRKAQTVVSFFIPFTKELVIGNRNHPYVSREWAVAYIETNHLIREICKKVSDGLRQYDVKAAWELPTPNFDEEKLMSVWSQRHIAYIAGIGTFGINNLLITDKGCAGRYGSFVIDYRIEPTIRRDKEKCLFKHNGSCGRCTELCPVGALTLEGFNRYKCNERVWEVDAYYNDLDTCDACGKCALGPCAIW